MYKAAISRKVSINVKRQSQVLFGLNMQESTGLLAVGIWLPRWCCCPRSMAPPQRPSYCTPSSSHMEPGPWGICTLCYKGPKTSQRDIFSFICVCAVSSPPRSFFTLPLSLARSPPELITLGPWMWSLFPESSLWDHESLLLTSDLSACLLHHVELPRWFLVDLAPPGLPLLPFVTFWNRKRAFSFAIRIDTPALTRWQLNGFCCFLNPRR